MMMMTYREIEQMIAAVLDAREDARATCPTCRTEQPANLIMGPRCVWCREREAAR